MYQDNIKILHLADLHLGKKFSPDTIIGSDIHERREEIWNTFERTLEKADSEGVEIVLLAGDIYENETTTLSNLERFAYILSKHMNMKFFIVLGNHDHISSKSKYLKDILSSNVFMFGNEYTYVTYKDKYRIYGYSWDRLEYKEKPFEFNELDSDFINILLLHATIASEGDYMPISKTELEELNFDYIALGHIHKPEKISDRIFYAGCMEAMSFNNTGPHGGILVELSGDTISTKFLKLSTRSYHNIDIDLSNINNNQELLSTLDNKLINVEKRDYVRIYFNGTKSLQINIDEVEEYLYFKYDNFELLDKSNEWEDLRVFIEENKDNIIGKYFKYIEKNYCENERVELYRIGKKAFITGD